MLAQPPLWFIVIAFLMAIGPLIFLHEFGHYWVARQFGIGAETFSIGFGREVAGWTDKRGTRWKVGWLPLGGYVRFVGDMNPASQPGDADSVAPEDRHRAFHLKPVWQRFLVVLAGPAANFLTAILILAGLFAIYGLPSASNLVTNVQPGGPAATAGVIAGDRITAIGGRATPSFKDISLIVSLRPDQQLRLTIDRGGKPLTIDARTATIEERDRFGQRFRIGRLGVNGGNMQYTRPPALELLPIAVVETAKLTQWMADGLWQIVSGRRSVREIGGPLKMAQVAGQQATLGVADFVMLLALFSINLGFINLLPVPMLDGGHLAFYAVEAVRRRPASAGTQEWAFRGGLALLLALILFTTVNDLASFGLFERLGRLIG